MQSRISSSREARSECRSTQLHWGLHALSIGVEPRLLLRLASQGCCRPGRLYTDQ